MAKKVFLLDSSAILNDFNFSFDREFDYVMSSKAVSELKDLRSKSLFESALQQGILSIKDPRPESVGAVMKKAFSMGFQKLSEADISILALGYEFLQLPIQFILVSDDYSIQNFCKVFGIRFEGVLHEKIKKTISFETKCASCGKEFLNETKKKKCDSCGGKIKKNRKAEGKKKKK